MNNYEIGYLLKKTHELLMTEVYFSSSSNLKLFYYKLKLFSNFDLAVKRTWNVQEVSL